MENRFKQFTEISYSGRQLLKKYPLNTEGIWEIRGEDPNCDWGGHHHQPYLATLRGRLRDVITLAVEMPGFWNWGAGGSITLIQVQEITPESTKEYIAGKARIRALEKELENLKKEYK